MRFPLNLGASEGGMNYDMPPEELPFDALTAVWNVRFADGHLERVGFRKQVAAVPNGSAQLISSMQVGNNYLWAIAGDSKLFALEGDVLTDISRESAIYTGGGKWSVCVLNTIPIFTNGIDFPQAWLFASPNTPVVDLPNWLTGETSLLMRSFYTVLISLGLTQGGTQKPTLVRWSSSTDPGAVPVSWDPSDPTHNVGEVDIADTPDLLVDGAALKDVFVVYKQQSIWLMQPTGGTGLVPSLFTIANASREIGLLSRDCIASVADQHFIVGNDDIGLFNGSSFKSLADKRLRRWFFANLNQDQYDKTFVYKDFARREIVIAMTPVGEETPSIGLAWNYSTDQWSARDVGRVDGISFGGQASRAARTWDTNTTTWDQDTGRWAPIVNPRANSVALGIADGNVVQLDSNIPDTLDNSACYVERLDWPFGQVSRAGQLFPAMDKIKTFRTIYPRLKAPKGTKFFLKYATRDSLDDDADPIVWQPTKSYYPDREEAIDMFCRGRYLSYRLWCETPVIWQLNGFDIEFAIRGDR